MPAHHTPHRGHGHEQDDEQLDAARERLARTEEGTRFAINNRAEDTRGSVHSLLPGLHERTERPTDVLNAPSQETTRGNPDRTVNGSERGKEKPDEGDPQRKERRIYRKTNTADRRFSSHGGSEAGGSKEVGSLNLPLPRILGWGSGIALATGGAAGLNYLLPKIPAAVLPGLPTLGASSLLGFAPMALGYLRAIFLSWREGKNLWTIDPLSATVEGLKTPFKLAGWTLNKLWAGTKGTFKFARKGVPSMQTIAKFTGIGALTGLAAGAVVAGALSGGAAFGAAPLFNGFVVGPLVGMGGAAALAFIRGWYRLATGQSGAAADAPAAGNGHGDHHS